MLAKSVVALVVLGGVLVVAALPANALAMTLYVNKQTGADTNACTTPFKPCATISRALTLAAPGATIYVAAGTYPEQVTITKAVTIIGVSPSRTIIDPTNVPLTDVMTDSGQVQHYIVDVAPGADAILQNLTVNGSGASSTFTGCSQGYTGIYYHDASGSLTKVDVVGVELPAPYFDCKDGLAVVVASDPLESSSVTMHLVTVNTYDQNGITCRDPGTWCTITNSTVTGIGPTSLISQNGIEVWSASAFIVENDISRNTYTGGGAGNEAHGIFVLNAGTLNAWANKVTSNDLDIYALEDSAYSGGSYPPLPACFSEPTCPWFIGGNKVSLATDEVPGGERGNGYGDGIRIDSTQAAIVNVRVAGNIASQNFEYGIALLGTSGVLVGGNSSIVPGKPPRNAAKYNYVGIYVSEPGTAAPVSSGNTIESNIARYNTLFNFEDLAYPANTWIDNMGPPCSPSSIC